MSYRFAAVLVALTACGSGGDAASDAPGTVPNDGRLPNDGGVVGDGQIVPTTALSIIVEPNGQNGAEVVTAINAATSSIEMTMYQIDDTDVINALVARAGHGVSVRAVLDSSSINKSWNMPAYTKLKTAGAGVTWSSTAFTYTHEKAVIIDDHTAWIMTMNQNNSSPGSNREYLAIDTDPADVAEAKAVFEADFALTAITPTGNLVVANANARTAIVGLINSATTTLDIEGEEFSDINQHGVVSAVVAAANRGVAVRVIVANDSAPIASQTSAIKDVKQVGAKVVVTGPTSGNGTATNPYIHAKAILVDCAGTTCARGFVGSENFSAGSLGYNRELGVIFAVPAELAKMKTAIDKDFAAGTAQ